MTHHVALGEVGKLNPRDIRKHMHGLNKPGSLVHWEIDLGLITGYHAFESAPNLVRNMNICSVVVF